MHLAYQFTQPTYKSQSVMTNDNFMFKLQLSWMYLNTFVYIAKIKEC